MGIAARRRLTILVPWVALIAVTAFAIARGGDRSGSPEHTQGHEASVEPASASAGDPNAGLPAPAAPPPETAIAARSPGLPLAAVAATEKALDEALADLARRTEEGEAARRETAAARVAGETAAATAALAEARVVALEAEGRARADAEGASEQEMLRLREEATRLEAELARAQDPLPGWLEDAASDDAARQHAARRAVGGASDEQIERLAALLDQDPTKAGTIALLAGGLPEGETRRDDLVRRVLLAEDAAAEARRRVAAIGERALRSYAVARPVLTTGAPPVVGEVLGRLAGRDLEWTEEERHALAKALTDVSPAQPTRIRAVGILALPGVADVLAELCAHDDPACRAAAAHALSRVPDREDVRSIAVALLALLLGDEELAVRTAGVHLAEAYLGEEVAFDPAAGAAERRATRDAILDRIQRAE